ncbi:uridine kinase [Kutzneria sp. CA-103260]|uniref:uridine kinase n=1 Tax=Kutzneria sp. CA-103260 TaxID=2802641 RepID=UPI001BA85675|nr:uridine kinase [Kutzneria sp. CA-103260]QUQ62730.1 uridine kinase [Kutzneria sp. CA-103260]
MKVRPVSFPVLVDQLADRIADLSPSRLRVLVDAAPAARPADLADALVDPLRLRGRSVLRVSAQDFLRPASLRFERGRTDPDSYFDDWLDINGLAREVLDPAAPDGSGSVLPSLWNAETDRASRASYVDFPSSGIVLLDGALLLGRWLPFDLTVHLDLSPAALRRRTPAEDRWTLPAFDRYRAEVEPGTVADVVVKVDDPNHPAVIDR